VSDQWQTNDGKPSPTPPRPSSFGLSATVYAFIPENPLPLAQKHPTQDSRAHKMYFLCKTNPILKMRNESNPLYQKILRQIGHLLTCKKRTQNEPKRTQSWRGHLGRAVTGPWPVTTCGWALAHADPVISESAWFVNGYSSFYSVWSWFSHSFAKSTQAGLPKSSLRRHGGMSFYQEHLAIIARV